MAQVLQAAPSTPSFAFHDLQALSPLGPCTPNNAWPWTVQFAPDGATVFVPLFGGTSGTGGCSVLQLDAQTMAQVDLLTVEESPEEIVFALDGQRQWHRTFVTNSSASSVSVFDANNNPLATIPIPVRPSSPWGTAFPFGMAVAPDQATVWVGTGEGRVFAIDVASLTIDGNRTLDYGDDHSFGRLTFAGSKLVLTTSQFHPGFQGATASVMLLDPDFPGTELEVFLATSATTALYPSPQNALVHTDGRLFVAGFDMGAQVFVIDPVAGILLDTWPTMTLPLAGKLQAMDLHGDFLCVADYWSGDLARIDTRVGAVAGTDSVQVFGQGPNALTFSPDASLLWIPFAGSDELLRLQVR